MFPGCLDAEIGDFVIIKIEGKRSDSPGSLSLAVCVPCSSTLVVVKSLVDFCGV